MPDQAEGADAPPAGLGPAERDALIVAHLGLAKHLARRFIAKGQSQDDLTQAASLALVKAAQRYDPSRGVEFSAYATRMIIGELKHHFRDTGWAVRAPRQIQEVYLEVKTAVSDLTQRLGRSPTVPELAEACGRSVPEVLQAIEAGRGYRTSSLDMPSGGEGGGVRPRELASDGDATSRYEDLDELAGFLSRLSERDRRLIELRFVDELSQSEIAQRLGVSQMQVSRLLQRALDALRKAYWEAKSG